MEAQRLWRRFQVHHTPKHASWLNVAEMEASLVSRECLGSMRIGHLHTLKSRVAAWRLRAEKDKRSIRWKFTVADARCVFRYNGIITQRSEHYQDLLAANGIQCSMSRAGNCIDNAAMESWFSTLKSELGERFESYAIAKEQLFDYIEVFYNQQRRHSAIDYVSPAEYEKAQRVLPLAA